MGTSVPWLTVRPMATKSASSSWLVPLRTGTRANRPAASAVPIGSVRTLPSTTPGISMKLGFTRSETGRWRRQAAVWSGQPAWAAKAWPAASAAARGRWLSAKDPLSMIAFWNSPREPAETMWASTDRPPADSPAIVTLCGLPPNRAILSRTQRSAACWSISP